MNKIAILSALFFGLSSLLTHAQQAPSPSAPTPSAPIAQPSLPSQSSSADTAPKASPAPSLTTQPGGSSGLQPGTIKAFQVKGKVEIYEGENLIGKLRRGQDLTQGMTILSGENSGALLMFSNGSTLNVGEKSKLELAVFLQEPFDSSAGRYAMLKADPSTSKAHSYLHYGEAIGTVKKLQSTSIFDIETPIGTAGIRGTTFYVSFGINENTGNYMMTVSNFDGEVIIESPIEAQLVMSDGSVASGKYNPYSGPKLYQVPKQALVILEAPGDLPLGPKEIMPAFGASSRFSDFFESSAVQSMLQELNAVTGASNAMLIFTPGGMAGPGGLTFPGDAGGANPDPTNPTTPIDTSPASK